MPQPEPCSRSTERGNYRLDAVSLRKDKVPNFFARAVRAQELVKPLGGEIFLRGTMMKADAAIGRRREDAPAQKRVELGVAPAVQNDTCVERSGDEARIRIMAWRTQGERLSKRQCCGNAFNSLSGFTRRERIVVGTIGVCFREFSRDIVIDHLRKPGKAPMRLPVGGEVDDISGALDEGIEATLIDAGHKGLSIGNADVSGQRATLVAREGRQLHDQKIARLALRLGELRCLIFLLLVKNRIKQRVCVLRRLLRNLTPWKQGLHQQTIFADFPVGHAAGNEH